MFGPALILLQRRVEAQPILAIALGLKIPCSQPTSFEAKSLGCNLFPLHHCGMLLGLFWGPLKRFDHWRKLLREIQQLMQEIRADLAVLGTNPRAQELKDRLMRDLDEQTRLYQDLTAQIVDLNSRGAELRVELAEAIRALDLEVPQPDQP